MFENVFKGKNVLVTGDTGFKGSWLCIWLLELGAEVYGYSLPPQGPQDNYVTTGLANHIHHQDGDIRDYQRFLQYFKDVKPEIAFHLAAQPLVRESYNSPRYTFETNVMGTVNFFEAIREVRNVKAAINITTDKCYRNHESDVAYKEDDPLGGQDPYSASKSCSEMVGFAYEKSFFNDSSCMVASARAGNVIGGGDWAKDRIIPDLFRSIVSGKPLSIRHPQAIRPWQHVLEPLSGYLHLAAGLFAQNKSFVGSWNFGPPAQGHVTVIDLVEHMFMALDRGGYMIDQQKNAVHESKLLKLDITKATTQLNWKPVLSPQNMLTYTIEGYEVELASGDIYQSRVIQIRRYMKLLGMS